MDLFSKLKVLKEILQTKEYTPIDILNYIKILLTILVTVAFAKIIFSKLKLIKSYLRSTMSQKRLSGLAILSIENKMLKELAYKNLISQFTSWKARKINFKWNIL